MEGDCKCDQQQQRENNHLQKCKNNLSEHDDVDACAGELGKISV